MNKAAAETVSTTLVVITVVVVVFGIIAATGYFAFNNTLQAKLQERKDNNLLYQDPGEQDILGLEATLPPIEIGKSKATQQNQQQLQMLQQQQLMQQMQQQQMQQQKKTTMQTAPAKDPASSSTDPKPTEKPTDTPTPTSVPDNVYVSTDGLFSVEHEKWNKTGTKTEGDTEIETLKSSDGMYLLHVGITKKKYDTVQAYLDTDMRGRKPKNGTTDITLGGETAKKANTFTLDTNGSTYKSIAGYVLSKDKEKVYSIELDSTELDVNNKKNEEVFDKIKSSFKFIEKKDDN